MRLSGTARVLNISDQSSPNNSSSERKSGVFEKGRNLDDSEYADVTDLEKLQLLEGKLVYASCVGLDVNDRPQLKIQTKISPLQIDWCS